MADITIRKENVELTVPEDQKDRYLKLGYSVYSDGKLVEEAPINDVGALRLKVSELEALVKQKDEEIKKLKQASAKQKQTK